ncbi:hypothetical protein D3C76_1054000 [compost metagenome]
MYAERPVACAGRGLRCTSGARAPPGYALHPPTPPGAIGWPGPSQTAVRSSRSNSCSRPPPHRPSVPAPGSGSRGIPGGPAPPRAGWPDRAMAVARPPRVPPAGGHKSPWPAGRIGHGRLCPGARTPCPGLPVPGCATPGRGWPCEPGAMLRGPGHGQGSWH